MPGAEGNNEPEEGAGGEGEKILRKIGTLMTYEDKPRGQLC